MALSCLLCEKCLVLPHKLLVPLPSQVQFTRLLLTCPHLHLKLCLRLPLQALQAPVVIGQKCPHAGKSLTAIDAAKADDVNSPRLIHSIDVYPDDLDRITSSRHNIASVDLVGLCLKYPTKLNLTLNHNVGVAAAVAVLAAGTCRGPAEVDATSCKAVATAVHAALSVDAPRCAFTGGMEKCGHVPGLTAHSTEPAVSHVSRKTGAGRASFC